METDETKTPTPRQPIPPNAVIVGMDGSPHSARALRWAQREAASRGAPLVATMAYTYLGQQHVGAPHFDPAYGAEDARAALDTYVERALGGDAARQVQRMVACDLPGNHLVEASTDAAVLVLGARGLGSVRGAMLGSVSRHCLHHARCPLAIVNSTDGDDADTGEVRRIVVGVDDSDGGFAALRWAVECARRHHAGVEAVHVRPPHTPPVGELMWGDSEEEQNSDALEMMSLMLASIDTSGLPTDVVLKVVPGAAARRLLELSPQADLIVVGSHERRGLHRLLSWVPGRLAHRAHCPVVIVPHGWSGDVEIADQLP